MPPRIEPKPTLAYRPPPHVLAPVAAPAPKVHRLKDGVAPAQSAVAEALAGIEVRDRALADSTRRTFEALVANLRRRSPQLSVADAQRQNLYFLVTVRRAVLDGRASGELVRMLRDYAWSADRGLEVNRAAKRLGEALAPLTAKVALPADFRDGPLRLPFTLEGEGRSVRAELVGEVKRLRIDTARARVGGRDLVVTEAALKELFNRAGAALDAQNSAPPELARPGLVASLLGRAPQAVHFDGRAFRLLRRSDLAGRGALLRKGSVKVDR